MRALLLLSLAAAACDGPPRRLVIRAGRLLDGTGAPARVAQRLLVEDGTITRIEPDGGEIPADHELIDWSAYTVMPGITDAHLHVAGSGSCGAGVGLGPGQVARNLYGLLASGVTTAVDLGAPLHVALAARRWSGTARHRGPRLLIAGPSITVTGGYLTDAMNGGLVEHGVAVLADDPEAARAHVRRLADAGVDVIKFAMQEVSYSRHSLAMPSTDVLAAVVDEAHTNELRAVVHATSNISYRLALDAGFDAIVHGALEPLHPDVRQLLAARRVPVVPTLFVFQAPLWGVEHPEHLERAPVKRVLSEPVRADLESYAARAREMGDRLPDMSYARDLERPLIRSAAVNNAATAKALHDLGVPLALGTDSGICFGFVGDPVAEARLLVAAGIAPADVVRIATSGSAGAVGLGDALGKLASGYRADLIAIDGAPDRDIDELEQVRGVVLDGVLQRPAPPDWTDTLALGLGILWTQLWL